MRNTTYNRYVLSVLMIVFAFNYIDRGLIILVLQPIKEDLHLTDTQLGFLTGIAFGLFYATLGLPIARWADRGDRVTITSIAIALWGGTVMFCLFVTSFPQLVVARIAAAVGESGCMPPTYSLVGDYFPRAAERTRAMAVYWLGNPLGLVVSFIVGGWLNEVYGWRAMFLVMGIPALAVSVLVKMTIKEPRTDASRALTSDRQLPSMTSVLATLWHQRSSRHLSIAVILLWTMGGGLAPWYAAFMMRSHGMGSAELGVWFGLIFGFGGMAGILFGGYTVGRWFGANERAQMRLSAVTVAALVPCFVAFLLLPQKHQALIALAPLAIVFSFFLGPTFALMQRLVIDEIRATALALVMLLSNLFGGGIGPQIVGILSDLLTPALGKESLRCAMLIISFVALWSAYHFWRVGRTVSDDLLAVSSDGFVQHTQSIPTTTC